jgi:uncharacterized protein (TIGR02147 family)
MKVNSAELLKEYYERKKHSRSGFSIRSFAKVLKVSPSFASDLIQGKKTIPSARIADLARLLELDDVAVEHLKSALAQEALSKLGFNLDLRKSAVKKFKLAPKLNFSILSAWYNVAILDFATCSNFQKDPAWIARKLGLTQIQVRHAISQLIAKGLIQETACGYQKLDSEIRMSLNESHPDIRNYHSQMMDKAKEELHSKTTQDDFKKREITGITIAANPKNVERARTRLIEALHEVAEILGEGEKTELYQINAQLFTLLKK